VHGKRKMEMKHNEATDASEKLAMRVSRNSIFANVILSAFKIIAGLVGHSGAMISDAIHSFSDVISTVVVIIGIKISAKDADEKHQYGHERMECVTAIVLAVILGITGGGIGLAGLKNVIAGNYDSLQIPSMIALLAAILSIAIKEGMYWYTRAAAKKINSPALMADAWHHRSDAFSSIGSFIGITGARLGYPVLDSVASIVICIFIIRAAVEIFMDAVSKMTDESCPKEVEESIRELILSQDGVIEIDELRTRQFGAKIYVDVEIGVAGDLSLRAAHEIAEQVHHGIEENVSGVKHCMVHVNPVD